MKTIVIGTFVLSLLLGAIFWYRDFYVREKFRKTAERKYKVVSPLIKRLASKQSISRDEIREMASNPSMRHALYRTLEAYHRLELFPAEYLTAAYAAESFLVNWLEFPTELGSAPEAIELLEKITLEEGEPLDYFVFKYKAKSPHWAADSGWMIGVSGPYRDNRFPYDVPLRVFSRFKTLTSISPKSEVEWVHEHINRSDPAT